VEVLMFESNLFALHIVLMALLLLLLFVDELLVVDVDDEKNDNDYLFHIDFLQEEWSEVD